MPLIEEFERSGMWLFRWRSYLPLVLAGIVFAVMKDVRYPFQSEFLDEIWESVCLLVGLLGLGIRALTAGYAPRNTSGRNTRRQVADTLNTTGMYSIVRNPLYLGNFFMGLGVVLFPHVWWVVAIYILIFALYYERIIFTEEMFLRRKFGDEYMEWASLTPAFIPRISRWRRPELTLSGRVILRREYQSLYGLVTTLFVLEETLELFLGHGFNVDAMWMWIMAVSTLFYFGVMFLHLKTRLLRIEGR